MAELNKGKFNLFIITGVLFVSLASVIGVVAISGKDRKQLLQPKETVDEIVNRILTNSPVIDGHNDFPLNVRNFLFNDLSKLNFSADMTQIPPWAGFAGTHTDLPRLRKGRVGGQFWVAYVSCTANYKDAVEQTFEQVDLIRRLVADYKNDMHFATSVKDIEDSIAAGKIASLIAIEGGHMIQFSMGILRTLYDLGARYLTLTHNCNTPWADAAPVDRDPPQFPPQSFGLSQFGLKIIDEMNRLGMIIDLSHVSYETMKAALLRSKAPVIFSHSSAYEICPHHRNVRDDILRLVNQTNSIVMVNFYRYFIRCDGQPATIKDVVDHIEHIRNVTSADNVGLGGDYDGIDATPIGLEDVSKYPDLIKALYETGRWSESDLEKLTGKNLLRVFRNVEATRDFLINTRPHEELLKNSELDKYGVNRQCITSKFPENEIQRNAKARYTIPA